MRQADPARIVRIEYSPRTVDLKHITAAESPKTTYSMDEIVAHITGHVKWYVDTSSD